MDYRILKSGHADTITLHMSNHDALNLIALLAQCLNYSAADATHVEIALTGTVTVGAVEPPAATMDWSLDNFIGTGER